MNLCSRRTLSLLYRELNDGLSEKSWRNKKGLNTKIIRVFNRMYRRGEFMHGFGFYETFPTVQQRDAQLFHIWYNLDMKIKNFLHWFDPGLYPMIYGEYWPKWRVGDKRNPSDAG